MSPAEPAITMKNNLLRLLSGLLVATALSAHAADQGAPTADFEPHPMSASDGRPLSSDSAFRRATQDELGLGIQMAPGQTMPDEAGVPDFGGDALDNEYRPGQQVHPVFKSF